MGGPARIVSIVVPRPVAARRLLSSALLVVACKGDTPAGVEPPAPPLRVETSKVELAAVPKTVRLTGSLAGDIESNLAANAAGRVTEVKVLVGSKVKKGDVLARLDVNAATLSAAEAATVAELARARGSAATRECERANKLFESGAISKGELDRLTDQCKTTVLDVRAAELRAGQASKVVGDGVVRSTFDGVVTARYVEPGEYVRPDSFVVQLATMDALRLRVEVPEAFVGAAQLGTEVRFGVSAYPDRVWRTKIDRPGVAVRAASRDVLSEAPVDNTDGVLLPGMFATVELTVGEEQLPSVPATAVTMHGDKARVFVVVSGHAHERAVQLGPSAGDRAVAVRRGLGANEVVVTAPPKELKNGQAVE